MRKSKFVTNKRPGRTRERAFLEAGLVAGIDEVGRGAWAGPVVAAAVVLPDPCVIKGIRDSKLLLAGERERIADRLREAAMGYGVGVVEVGEINQFGLTWAVVQSGRRALAALPERPGAVLLDGNSFYLKGEWQGETIIDGDCLELTIAAASILAKVHRDALMRGLDTAYPEYSFGLHKGYGTPDHQAALREHGPSQQHRARYTPIAALLQQDMFADLPQPDYSEV